MIIYIINILNIPSTSSSTLLADASNACVTPAKRTDVPPARLYAGVERATPILAVGRTLPDLRGLLQPLLLVDVWQWVSIYY